VDGMLGGFAHVNDPDVKDSTAFIAELHKLGMQYGSVIGITVTFVNFSSCCRVLFSQSSMCLTIDCGAGIGRVSKNLLVHLFQHVDLVVMPAHCFSKS
jgi:protein N-terminal methyltransferase